LSKRRFRIPLIFCGAALLLAGYVGSSTAKSTKTSVPAKKIAYVEIFLAAPIEMRINNAFVTAAKHVGWSVNTTDAKGLTQTAAAQMQAAINAKVDAIVLGSVEPAVIVPQLKAAAAAHIPVVAIAGESRHNNDNLLNAVYTENDVSLSTPLGHWMCGQIKPGSQIAILRFDLFSSGKERGDTLAAMAKQCGLKVVAQPQTQQTFSDAQAKTAAILTQYPNLAAVVPVYDTFTAGAVGAIKQANKVNQVKVYSYYADAINAPLMKANPNIAGLSDCDCVKEAAYAVDRLLAHFTANTALPHFFNNAPSFQAGSSYIHYAVVSRDNIPPKGQDGPVAISAALAPFFKKWDAMYTYAGG
jgi:ABC-type sugar transport system substrate-binding protein